MTIEPPSPTSPGRGAPPPRGARRVVSELFFISFLVLFLELACIRWFGATVLFLTFFTNIVLMASFLGVSVGCLASRRSWSWIQALVPLALVAAGSAIGFLWLYNASPRLIVDVGSQQSPQFVYFGTESRVKDPSKWVVPMEALAAYFFVAIALMFIGPGQEMGRRFAAIENRLVAYTADILGSLTGIVAFGLLAYFRAPPTVWFLIALAIGLYFVPRRRWLHGVGAVGVLGLIALADWPADALGVPCEVVWSPYYQVRFTPRHLSIDVNNIRQQGMVPIGRAGPAYQLPHALNRDAGNQIFEDVLIIGAGSGNDVAAALSNGARHVDAVEIDREILELGRRHHPNRPYRDARVTVHLDDGRGFLRSSSARYDLICYALVDSLVLHSSYSSVRLESFLFTEQAFRDVKARLKPGGVFAMYNFYRQGWVVGRLVRLAEKVFGTRPLVVSMPYQSVITPSNNQRNYSTCLLIGNGSPSAVEAIRARFEEAGPLWFSSRGWDHGTAAPVPAFGAARPEPRLKVGPARVEQPEVDWEPTDDWPFLYLREPRIPALNWRGAAIVAVLSVAILLSFAPKRAARPNHRMFFLGAGFMLLETKGVVHMALLFGATWFVNSIVFFAILLMVLSSNLYVMRARPRRLAPYYALLIGSLAINIGVPMSTFLALPGASKVVASCVLVFLPVFFAGVIFATLFQSSTRPDEDFGANIGGIILGGLSEHLSMIVGFNHLLTIAIGFYLLSALPSLAGRRPKK